MGPIIRHAIWLHVRFKLSYRDVEDLPLSGCLIRNGSAMGIEIWAVVCPRADRELVHAGCVTARDQNLKHAVGAISRSRAWPMQRPVPQGRGQPQFNSRLAVTIHHRTRARFVIQLTIIET